MMTPATGGAQARVRWLLRGDGSRRGATAAGVAGLAYSCML
jgi:hypothetical protein